MSTTENPYEAPTSELVSQESVCPKHRRSLFGTFLLFLWLFEGGCKALFVGKAMSAGVNPFPMIVQAYQTTSLWLFFLAGSFVCVETIGPWVGIYYLTGARARRLSTDLALYQTIKVAGFLAIATSLVLILFCHIAVI